MRQTHNYKASQYANENASPLAWIIHLFTKRKSAHIAEEAEEYHRRNDIGRRKRIVGRVAGPEAFTGNAAIPFQPQSSDKIVNTKQRYTDLKPKASPRISTHRPTLLA